MIIQTSRKNLSRSPPIYPLRLTGPVSILNSYSNQPPSYPTSLTGGALAAGSPSPSRQGQGTTGWGGDSPAAASPTAWPGWEASPGHDAPTGGSGPPRGGLSRPLHERRHHGRWPAGFRPGG